MSNLPYLFTASAASLHSLPQGGKLISQPNSIAWSIKSLPALSLSGHNITRLLSLSIRCACSGVTPFPKTLMPSISIASNTPSTTGLLLYSLKTFLQQSNKKSVRFILFKDSM